MTLHSLLARLAAHRRYHATVESLSSLSDHQLKDIGIRRFDIPYVAAGDVASPVRHERAHAPGGAYATMTPVATFR